jgi:hypothetical protein
MFIPVILQVACALALLLGSSMSLALKGQRKRCSKRLTVLSCNSNYLGYIPTAAAFLKVWIEEDVATCCQGTETVEEIILPGGEGVRFSDWPGRQRHAGV